MVLNFGCLYLIELYSAKEKKRGDLIEYKLKLSFYASFVTMQRYWNHAKEN